MMDVKPSVLIANNPNHNHPKTEQNRNAAGKTSVAYSKKFSFLMRIIFNLIFGNNAALVKRQTIEIAIIHQVKMAKLRILRMIQLHLHFEKQDIFIGTLRVI